MKTSTASIIGAVVLVGMIAPTARGDNMITLHRAVLTGALPTQGPGKAFSLDFSDSMSGYEEPFELAQIGLVFSCQTPYSGVKIALDSSGEVFEFAPTAPSPDQTAILLYDPRYPPGPGSTCPTDLLPPAWAQELADGTLSGTVWVVDAPWAPQWGHLGASAVFHVPAPATPGLLACGLFLVLARRRRARRGPGGRPGPPARA